MNIMLIDKNQAESGSLSYIECDKNIIAKANGKHYMEDSTFSSISIKH